MLTFLLRLLGENHSLKIFYLWDLYFTTKRTRFYSPPTQVLIFSAWFSYFKFLFGREIHRVTLKLQRLFDVTAVVLNSIQGCSKYRFIIITFPFPIKPFIFPTHTEKKCLPLSFSSTTPMMNLPSHRKLRQLLRGNPVHYHHQ